MSTYKTSANRRPTSTSLGRRAGVIGLVLAILTLTATAAWAYWSTTGNGTGSAVTGTLNSPTILSASSTAGSGQVGVSWQAPTGGSTPAGYYVERTATGGGTPEDVCSSSLGQLLNETSCTDTSVPDGQYTYVVTAVLNSWTAASGPSSSVVVTNTIATTTSLVPSPNPSVVGQAVTYTATVSAASGTPTGTVTFKDDGNPINCTNAGGQTLSGGQATCQVTYSATGGHPITAEYGGATGFAGSTSPTVSQMVNNAATSTALASSANPSKSGQQVTYTATVSVTSPGAGTPTGTVTFMDGTSTICASVALTGTTASCSVTYASVGSHSVTAEYGGDAKFLASTSPAWNQGVNQAATSTGLVSSANPAVTGQQVTYTATVNVTGPGAGTPTGSVVFKNGAVDIACGSGSQTFNGSTATCVTSFATAGGRTITAVYAGDSNFTGSTSNEIAQTVNKASTSTTLTALPTPSTTGQSVTLTATVSAPTPGAGVPGGTVAFKDGATTITSCGAQPLNGSGVATCTTSFATAGGRTLNADYSGNADYNASTGSTSHTVNMPVSTATTLTSSANPVKTGQTVTYTATVSTTPSGGTVTGTVVFRDGGTPIAGCAAQPVNGAGAATCSQSYASMSTHVITASYSGDATYPASPTSNTITQRVVNGNVTGLGFTNVQVNGSNPSTSCPTAGTSSYTCTLSAGNNTSLSANVLFVNSAGVATVYSLDDRALAVTVETKNTLTNPVRSILGNSTTTSTPITGTKSGSDFVKITVTLTDGPTTWTAVLHLT